MNKINIFLSVLTCAITASSCGVSKVSNKTYHLCFDSPKGAGGTTTMLRRVSSQFGYRFQEYGSATKADLQSIDANPSVLPDQRPIQADIKRSDGKVLLMVSNFGVNTGDLRLSFFFYRDEGFNSPFHRAVISGVRSVPGARLYSSDAEVGALPCGRKN
jgi:hypothetical protein